jgi:UDP-hydrolysing UDP-N-acetyl-D-glucosamine 2-epimerase
VRTIGVVTTSRADYGIYLPVLRRIESDPGIRLQLIVSGSHLSAEFGFTVRAIEKDGFEIAERVEMLLSSDSPEATAKSMGLGLLGFGQVFSRTHPDLLLALGDRFEMHAAVLAALPFRIPVAHIHGGEITLGAFDDALRHSMTKLSHLHFVSTAEHGRRVIQLGEEPWRVTVSGAPSLDNLRTVTLLTRDEVENRFNLHLGERFLLVTFHPATLDPGDPADQMRALLAAVDGTGLPAIVTMPNADPGGEAVRAVIRERAGQNSQLQPAESFGTVGYFSLMALASAMVGNSSSGIVEAASFGLPVVDVGSRQAGRSSARNVIHVPATADGIALGIQQALDPRFRETLDGLRNPYGDGHAADRIVDRLSRAELGPSLLLKRFADAPSAGD